MIQLPAYAPELNPVETPWAHVKSGLGNLAARTVDELAAIGSRRSRKMVFTLPPENSCSMFSVKENWMVRPGPTKSNSVLLLLDGSCGSVSITRDGGKTLLLKATPQVLIVRR